MNTFRKYRTIVPALMFFLWANAAVAQEAAKWSAEMDKATFRQGESGVVRVKAAVNQGWHIYSTTPMEEGPVATSIEFTAPSPLEKTGKIKQPKPIVRFDEAFGINTEYFEKAVTFTLPVRVKADAAAGKQKATIEVTFMACNDRLCLPPTTVELPVSFTVEPGEMAVASMDSGTVAPATDTAGRKAGQGGPTATQGTPPASSGQPEGYGDERDVARARAEGLWAYLGLAMSVGLLALLTPCVFPMIPITVSFFTKRESGTRWRSVRDALIYSFGIIFTFTGLGILLAVMFGASGINQFAANPWMNILIAAIFVVFALNLFGLFEIVVPSSILTKLTVASGSGQGIASLLLMGLTFTLTSFTCTVPFVGTVMVAAASGDIWWSVLGMLAFSTVFAFPFFLLAVFPSWLKSLPKSGGWLNSVKVVMGFLELAAAMKFLSNVDLILGLGVLSRDLFLALWVGIFVTAALYLLAVFQLPHDSKVERIGVFRMIFSMFFIGISFFLYNGMNGRPLGELDAFLPPIQYSETIEAAGGGMSGAPSGTGKEQETWTSNYAAALAQAKKESKPVFIDFTGFSCTNCRWMEANVFTKPAVRERLKNYVLVRLYTDGRGETYLKNRTFQEQRFGTVALPLYVIMTADDKVVSTFPGMTRKPEEFVTFLDEGLKGQPLAVNLAP